MLILTYDNEGNVNGRGSYSEEAAIPDSLNYVVVTQEDLDYELTIVDDGFGGKKVQRGELKGLIKVLSKYQFRARFTIEEKVIIENFETHPTLTDEQKAVVRVILKDIEVSDVIELTDPALSAGVDILVSYGLLTEERKAEILAITENA